MKHNRHFETAKKFNIVEQVNNLENDLMKIDGVVGVEFDLDSFYDNLNHVIFLTKYEIDSVEPCRYFRDRTTLKKNVLNVAKKHGLIKTEDAIEDYGQHFYFVFRFQDNSKWKVA